MTAPDCEGKRKICRAICCRLWPVWPGAEAYCSICPLLSVARTCMDYENRPQTCRDFDCRDPQAGIWADYEAGRLTDTALAVLRSQAGPV
jgi:hypothetical protein